ncbi:MAG: hypothetical protein ABIG98_02635 [Chloroflexota bacterium]
MVSRFVHLRLKGKVKMLAAGIANIVVGLFLGIYSGLSLDTRLMCLHPFRWFPVARFYANALHAISELSAMKPAKRDYAATDGSAEQVGIIDNTNRGFKELFKAMRKAGMVNQDINSMELKEWICPTWDNSKNQPFTEVRLTLRLMKDEAVVKELSIESTEILKDATEKVIRRSFAVLTIVLSIVLFTIGMVLVLISIGRK